jgi:hypothetical protein
MVERIFHFMPYKCHFMPDPTLTPKQIGTISLPGAIGTISLPERQTHGSSHNLQ